MTLAELWETLRGVDWFYEMADDPLAYRRGEAQVAAAHRAAVELGAAGIAMFAAFQAHYSLNGGNAPLPPKPVVGAE